MRRSISLPCLFLFLMPQIVFADGGDDTLRSWLSKSDLVVNGKITSNPLGVVHEEVVPNYYCQFKIEDVLKGDAKLKGKTVGVNIRRFEMDKKDHHPLIKKDGECILFLKKAQAGTIPPWVTADFWFGVQHPSPWMARSLKRVASTERTEPARAAEAALQDRSSEKERVEPSPSTDAAIDGDDDEDGRE